MSLDGTTPEGAGVNVAYSVPSANRLRTADGAPLGGFVEITNIFVKNRGDRTPPTLLSAIEFDGPRTPQELLDAGANLVDEPGRGPWRLCPGLHPSRPRPARCVGGAWRAAPAPIPNPLTHERVGGAHVPDAGRNWHAHRAAHSPAAGGARAAPSTSKR